jgi:hypothetical protein
MWVIGGYDGAPKNDVWYSTDGISWIQATSSAQWTARYFHTSVVYDNKMWVIGGYDGALKNDVWYSNPSATWLAPEDTATSTAKNTNIRLRFSIKNTGGPAENYNFRLQFAELGSYPNCTSVPSTDFSDVPTTTGYAVIMATSSYFADGDNTSNVPGGLTDPPGFSWQTGKMVEYPSNQTQAITLNQNYFTEIEYVFKFTNNAADGTSYCFRIRNNGTADLDSYTQVAKITTTVQYGVGAIRIKGGTKLEGGVKLK